MKNSIKWIVSCLCLLLLTGCDLDKEAEKAVDNTAAEIEQAFEEAEKEVDDKIGEIEVLSVKSTDKKVLEPSFTGTIYLMASRDQLERGFPKKTFSLAGKPFESIQAGSADDFNIRHAKKTWFSIQKVSVQNLDKLDIASTVDDDVVLVLKK
ncbi:hypothetical protein [Streptococcus merionis]|uniref:Lipoprotein n=1 Tax=Streptococcus merionis TaxID=400065 RepID=A0A239SYT0_9STRE|nr:hypothetical protein [Streptococcus merionis]SNU90486.1 lipoprotein [Streptococcus merionis]